MNFDSEYMGNSANALLSLSQRPILNREFLNWEFYNKWIDFLLILTKRYCG